MPLYEYECERCKRRTEVISRLSDPPLAECPHCGGPVRRLLSAPAFQFKGSGWYVTDYAGRKASSDQEPAEGKKAEGKESEGKEPAAAKSEAGTAAEGEAPGAKSVKSAKQDS